MIQSRDSRLWCFIFLENARFFEILVKIEVTREIFRASGRVAIFCWVLRRAMAMGRHAIFWTAQWCSCCLISDTFVRLENVVMRVAKVLDGGTVSIYERKPCFAPAI